MQRDNICTVTISYDTEDESHACDTPATIKCGGTWWCQEHYDDFHPDGQCYHTLPGEE